MEKLNHMQAELEELRFQDSTLSQQIDQFQQACAADKDKLGRMRLVQLLIKVSIHGNPTMTLEISGSFTIFMPGKVAPFIYISHGCK